MRWMRAGPFARAFDGLIQASLDQEIGTFGIQAVPRKPGITTTAELSPRGRRTYLRFNPVPGRVFAWALVAGALSIVALAGYWIVMFQLFRMPGNLIPDMSRYPLPTLVALLVMGSLAAPFSEEAAFRGYAQVMLERKFRAPVAIVISSIMFALAHLTQGFLFPKLFVYFLAGLAFGVTAYLTKSILPGIVVHILADLTFFTLVWPHDTTRTDAWFWLHVAQAGPVYGIGHCGLPSSRIRDSTVKRIQ